jgi:hypothetical protein
MGNSKNKGSDLTIKNDSKNNSESKLVLYLSSKKPLTMKELDQNRLKAYEPIFK